jgi:hypothetical protein
MPTRTIDNYDGPATFTLENGSAVDVSCTYTVQQDYIQAGAELIEGLIGWAGFFVSDVHVDAGFGTITLPDGRSGEIVVNQVTIRMGVGAGVTGRFSGNGAAPS